MGTVSALAAAIGPIAGVIAYLLYNLIGFFTNVVFFHRFHGTSRARVSIRWVRG